MFSVSSLGNEETSSRVDESNRKLVSDLRTYTNATIALIVLLILIPALIATMCCLCLNKNCKVQRSFWQKPYQICTDIPLTVSTIAEQHSSQGRFNYFPRPLTVEPGTGVDEINTLIALTPSQRSGSSTAVQVSHNDQIIPFSKSSPEMRKSRENRRHSVESSSIQHIELMVEDSQKSDAPKPLLRSSSSQSGRCRKPLGEISPHYFVHRRRTGFEKSSAESTDNQIKEDLNSPPNDIFFHNESDTLIIQYSPPKPPAPKLLLDDAIFLSTNGDV